MPNTPDSSDTTANRRRLEPLRQLVGRAVAANEDPTPVLDQHFPTHARAVAATPPPPAVAPAHEGPTVDEYTTAWIRAEARAEKAA